MVSKKKAARRALSAVEIRQAFLDFFAARGHTIVPSMSLVPGADPTLLFTNSGMVQFKDMFLGTGSRPYSRVADSQKCLRVAGKHNDLDDVGRDDSHHTFFEMLGNWSFGDYYKREAIAWAWELLTEVWQLPADSLWATCFEDERGEIPRDEEAAALWLEQPGFDADHLLYFGRKGNFWEMADAGPCGPDTEVHIDLGPDRCAKRGVPGHVCRVNGDCERFLELWNLVFIQYNRSDATHLELLPRKHVDTGMGFERLVSVLQGVDSNYQTDLFVPLLDAIQGLAGHTDSQRRELFTPYRVIADHVRAAAFLIADGVVPGNLGRNYVCRMIIRRASRFGSKAGFDRPFLAPLAETVIERYGSVYAELDRNRAAIMQTLTSEEERFRSTVDSGVAHLMTRLEQLRAEGHTSLDGATSSGLYTTYGLPLEITRDIAREHGLEVDEAGFHRAMEAHRLASGAGALQDDQAAADETQIYGGLLADLQASGKLGPEGVSYDPYSGLETEGPLLALVCDGRAVEAASPGERVAVVLPATHFYVESGGQVSDTGTIVSTREPRWEIRVQDMRRPVAGMVAHIGEVVHGMPRLGDTAIAAVDAERRWDIMRNHTATHLLHASLRALLGQHARQAGSLVAPDRLRFDFTHPRAVTAEELERIEAMVNDAVLANHELDMRERPRGEAVSEGAMALFGETYGETVRTISIGDAPRFSYELCGGTHVPQTGVIGPFVILSESSVAAGIRRIEAATGRAALGLIRARLASLSQAAARLGVAPEVVESRVEGLLAEREELVRQVAAAQGAAALDAYRSLQPQQTLGVAVLTGLVPNASAEVLRELTDRFRTEHPTGVAVLASAPEGKPVIVAAVSQDLVARGLHAGEMVKAVAAEVGGGGGGKPQLAQAGGKDPSRLPDALRLVPGWIEAHLR